MAQTKPNSGGSVNNNGGAVIQGGNINAGRFGSAQLNDLSLVENTQESNKYGSRVVEAVSPASSGNLGTKKPASGGKFSNLEEGAYIAKIIMTKAAGVANTTLQKPSSDFGQLSRPAVKTGDRQLDVTSWNRQTGAPTYGANRGAAFTFASGQDNVIDHAYIRDPFVNVAELTFQDGSADPVMKDYPTPKSL